jgi:cytochrome P450
MSAIVADRPAVHDPFQLGSAEMVFNPYPTYHRLRAEAPVYWSEVWGGWVVTRYEDVRAILLDARFSNARTTAILRQLPDAELAQLQDLRRYMTLWLGYVDDRDHTRQRASSLRALAPRLLEAMRPQVSSVIDRLIDRVQPDGQMDAIADLAYPLPATVIADLIGIPVEERTRFKEASDDFVAFSGLSRPSAAAAHRAQQGLRAMINFLRPEYSARRAHPRQDIMSVLIACEQAGMLRDEEEVLVLCIALAVGGHETTTNLIGNGLLALLQNPDEMEKLKARPELIHSAVEELLRYDSSLQRLVRIAKQDLEIRGELIRAGQIVFPVLGAANRDPTVFPNPDELDIERADNRHLAFGYGPRFCLGAPLARLEGQLAVGSLLRRLPKLRLTEREPQRHANIAFRGLKSLPVAF